MYSYVQQEYIPYYSTRGKVKSRRSYASLDRSRLSGAKRPKFLQRNNSSSIVLHTNPVRALNDSPVLRRS